MVRKDGQPSGKAFLGNFFGQKKAHKYELSASVRRSTLSLVSQVVSINEQLDAEMNADNKHAKLTVKLIETLLLYIDGKEYLNEASKAHTKKIQGNRSSVSQRCFPSKSA